MVARTGLCEAVRDAKGDGMRGLRMTAGAVGLVLLVAGVAAGQLPAAAQGGIPVDPADAGEAIAFGDGAYGRIDVPPLPAGLSYTAAAAGVNHTVVLRSDGAAIAFGDGTYGQTSVPALPPGLRYTAVAAGTYHTVLLRSDGAAIAFGMDQGDGNTQVPPLPAGVTYTAVAAGAWHTALLRSDGQAVAFGYSPDGRTDVPPLPAGVVYTAVTAGYNATALLRSDGQVVVMGVLMDGVSPVGVPPLPPGVTYVDLALGYLHLVLLRSDGTAVAVGYYAYGQTSVPPLPPGETYTAVVAGHHHTVLLRSDGQALAFGDDASGQATVPALPEGMSYTAAAAGQYHTVLIRSEDPVDTTTTLAGPATAAAGDTIVLTATVTPAAAGPGLTGVVRFAFEDSTQLDVPVAADGTATATTTRTLPGAGTYVATATYLGATDGHYRASAASDPVTTTVASSHTIRFLVDGAVHAARPVAAGEQLTSADLPPAPVKPGHDFLGWWHGATPLALPLLVSGDLDLEARWAAWEARLTLSATTAAPGDVVVVTGTGFVPGETVTLTLNPTLGVAMADATGAFSFSFTMPAVTPGPHTIAAHRGSATAPVVASASLAVTALATTGSEVLPVMAAGAGLLASGVVMLAWRRRRAVTAGRRIRAS